jgi:hypothetical protein
LADASIAKAAARISGLKDSASTHCDATARQQWKNFGKLEEFWRTWKKKGT